MHRNREEAKMRPIRNLNATATIKAPELPPPATTQPRSPWHSPVPYLFGGLAAMLSLIAFALLILACSYWRLSGRLDDSEGGYDDQRDLESGKEGDAEKGAGKVYEEKILVIMAGDQKPTFLATPVSSRASSFGDKNAKIENREEEEEKTEIKGDKIKGEIGNNYDETSATRTDQEQENGETDQEAHQAQ